MMYYSVQRTGGDLETNVAHSCLESLLITRKQWVGVCGWQSSELTKRLIPIYLPMLKCSMFLLSSSCCSLVIAEFLSLHNFCKLLEVSTEHCTQVVNPLSRSSVSMSVLVEGA